MFGTGHRGDHYPGAPAHRRNIRERRTCGPPAQLLGAHELKIAVDPLDGNVRTKEDF